MAQVSTLKVNEVSYGIRAMGLPYGVCSSSSTSTQFVVNVPGIDRLVDGVFCLVKNGVVTSASGFTLNVNGLGAKPCYTNLAASTRDTTVFNKAYTMLFIYDSTRVAGGCWICYRGYDSNTNTIGFQLRTNSTTLAASDTSRYYKIFFTSADNTKLVPASVDSTEDTTTARPVNTRAINPFGRIVYLSSSSLIEGGSLLPAANIWDQYTFKLGYSFNRTGEELNLTEHLPVYVKCSPQNDGSALIDTTNPITQVLPNSNDGNIYIHLGVAVDATTIELHINHPVFYNDGAGIKIWTGNTGGSLPSNVVIDSNYVHTDNNFTNAAQSKLAGLDGKQRTVIQVLTPNATPTFKDVEGTNLTYAQVHTILTDESKEPVLFYSDRYYNISSKMSEEEDGYIEYSFTFIEITSNGASVRTIIVDDYTEDEYLETSYSSKTLNVAITANAGFGQGYMTQTNASASASVTATLTSYTIANGGIVVVKFNYDVPANATLNISSKGAKALYFRGSPITAGVIKAGDTATFITFTNYYHLISNDRWGITELTK